MMKVSLKEGVVLDPLLLNWFAWPALISPATSAFYLRNHYLPMIESYIEEPELHETAAKNAAMRAGPFLRYNGERDSMVGYFSYAKERLTPLLDLAESVNQTNKALLSLNGYSARDLYASLPAPLRGLVEFVYDLSHSPSIRFIEPLLYASRYFDPSLQGARLRLIHDHDPFFSLNTPMFGDEGPLFRIPFSARFYDLLGRARTEQIDLDELMGEIPATVENASGKERLMQMFREDGPRRLHLSSDDTGPRIRYFGHATVLFELDGMSVLTDPCISPTMPVGAPARFDYADLPEVIDVVLITHNHQDHVVFETLLQLRTRIKQIVVPRNGGGFLQDPSLKLMLQSIGFSNVTEVSELDKISLGPVEITAVPFLGEHGELNVQTKCAYHIRAGAVSALLLADSDVIDPYVYDGIRKHIGNVDLLFVGMDSVGAPFKWLYGPLFSQPLDHARGKDRRINGSNAVKALELVRIFEPKGAYVYAMGAEPWISPITGANTAKDSPQAMEAASFIGKCREKGIASDLLYWSADIPV